MPLLSNCGSLHPSANPEAVARQRLPVWFRRQFSSDGTAVAVEQRVHEAQLHTVCESARCPNLAECWSRRQVTFMILGERCTRACRFCAVATARPRAVDPDEPRRLAEAIAWLGLEHAVITAVARDDLADGGAGQMARVIEAIRSRRAATSIEVLVPDYRGEEQAIEMVLAARPEVFAHNLETVERLTPSVRPQARYERSLDVLRLARERRRGSLIKSSLMVGLGEREDEVGAALADLRSAGCELVTIGQYLQPTEDHLPVGAFIPLEQFQQYEARAYELGFRWALCGPYVRSSYYPQGALAQLKEQLAMMESEPHTP
ncbi:MAG: lipoyl synthase [Candidatus Omnitrophica bacterium]|nr:lipoyl synthase [Candidatus Omnitrophota bacterium]